MGLFYTGKQKYNNYIVRENLDGVNGQRVPTGMRSFSSAVEPGCGRRFSGLSSDGYYTRYVDITMLIKRKFLQTILEVSQTSVFRVRWWCDRTNLSVSSNKTIVFTFH
jgi:hypothetical protein